MLRYSFFVALAAVIALSSCSDDDSSEPSRRELVTGTWNLTEAYGKDQNGQWQAFDQPCYDDDIMVMQDGTVTWYSGELCPGETSGLISDQAYSLNDDETVLNLGNNSYTILELTENSMIWESSNLRIDFNR